jgi:hypothetical protein
MCASAVQNNFGFRECVDQKPIRRDVTFPIIIPITLKSVWTTTRWKRFVGNELIHDGLELRTIAAAPMREVCVFLEPVAKL